MGKESTCILMGRLMKGTGRRISSMGSGRKNGQMGLNMKGSMLMGRKLAKGGSLGLTQVLTKEISKMPSRVLELTHGLTSDSILESGKITKCTGKEFSRGQMGVDLKVFTSTTKSTEMDFLRGQTADHTKGHGLMASKTESENTSTTEER